MPAIFEMELAVNGARLVDPSLGVDGAFCVGIEGGKVAKVSASSVDAETVIDGSGLVLCPGFVDVHSHLEGSPRGAELSLMQGITTAVCGNCGMNFAPGLGYSGDGMPLDAPSMEGACHLRELAGVKCVHDAATCAEICEITRLARLALDNGAAGISFGLDYAPGTSPDEMRPLLALCAEYGRPAAVHTRVRYDGDTEPLVQLLTLAHETGAKLQLSHFVYQYGEEESILSRALRMVGGAIAGGVDVAADSGMYSEWSTLVGTAVFDETVIESDPELLERFAVITGPYRGQRFDMELYRTLRRDRPGDSAALLVENPQCIAAPFSRPWVFPSTDAMEYAPGEGHPQIAGSFPRYFRMLVREAGALTLYDAVERATILPARRFGLDAGTLAEGADADMVLFDPETISDRAWFPPEKAPDAAPVGIDSVIRKGRIAVRYRS